MKEKIINYIEQLEAKAYQSDDYFKQRNDLYIENQRLNNNNQDMQEEMVKTWKKYDELLQRIDKAIEYIDRRDIEWGSEEHNKLLSILKGDR